MSTNVWRIEFIATLGEHRACEYVRVGTEWIPTGNRRPVVAARNLTRTDVRLARFAS